MYCVCYKSYIHNVREEVESINFRMIVVGGGWYSSLMTAT